MPQPLPETVDGKPILFRPLPGFQMRAAKNGAFETLLGGAAGPGKTSILIALAAKYAAESPNARVIFFRTVYKDTLDIRDRMQALYPRIGAKWVATDTRWQFAGGGTVQIAHAKTMNEIMDYLGPEYTAVLWDELALVPEEKVWQMILGRIRSTDPTVKLRARASANPIGPGRAWLRERFIEACGKAGERVYSDETTGRTRAYVPGTAQDNPLLPSTYWDGLRDLPPSVQAALREGDWDMALGLFYPELLQQSLLMQRDDLPHLHDWYEFWGGYDWGFSHPAAFGSYVRVSDTLIIKLDTLYLHRFQDEEQAATIRGTMDRRCFKTVYAGGDAFAQRKAHSVAPETVADVFDRYEIHLERATVDKVARAKALRRFFATIKPGPLQKDTLRLQFLDTPGNRRCLAELAALVPDELNVNVPAKRDASERGLNGDDGADETSFALATPSFEPVEAMPVYRYSNVSDGKAEPAPWEILENQFRMPNEDGVIDRRVYAHRVGIDALDQQFPG